MRVVSDVKPARLPCVCSTPDYITPEMPQVANEFDDDDKVGKMVFYSLFLSVGISYIIYASAVVVCCRVELHCLLGSVQENIPCPKSPEKSANPRSKRYRTGE